MANELTETDLATLRSLRVRYWSRPRRSFDERARYALLISSRSGALLAYGDADDSATPRISLYPLDEEEGAAERRLLGNGYQPCETPPVTWVDARSSFGRRNLVRIAGAIGAPASSLALEAALRARTSAEEVLGTVLLEGETLSVIRSRYPDGTSALLVTAADGAPYAALSVYTPEADLGEDEVAIKNWSENAALAKGAFASGLFEDTGRVVATGFAKAPIWHIR